METAFNFGRGSAATLVLTIGGLLLMSANALAQGTYYIAANGSNSNNGTSKSTPWLHAPGMPNCTGVCASTKPTAGDRFIFRGGDTWHFGNSGASPYTGSKSAGANGIYTGWQILWSGATGNLIYWGVDKTWYTGGSWARPIMNGDNPTSTTGVTSCTYDQKKFAFTQIYAKYNQIDDLEYTGMCWSGAQQSSDGWASYIWLMYGDSNPTYNKVSNVYLHGWTHKTYNCSWNGGYPSGDCDGASGIMGPSSNTSGIGDEYDSIVCDGSDTDKRSFGCVMWGCYMVHNSVLRNASQGAVCNNAHDWHDNLIENIEQSGDGVSHGNGVEFNTEAAGDNYFYNNVIRNNFVIGNGVTTWFTPNATDYYFNNVYYGTVGGQVAFDTSRKPTAAYWFNNTYVDAGTVGGVGSYPGYLKNNLYINTTRIGTPVSNQNTVALTTIEATARGFTLASMYAPTSANCNGLTPCPIGTGANLTSDCPKLGAAFCSDSTRACTYNTITHSVTCPATPPLARPSIQNWDAGALGYRPQPPTSLQQSTSVR